MEAEFQKMSHINVVLKNRAEYSSRFRATWYDFESTIFLTRRRGMSDAARLNNIIDIEKRNTLLY